MIVDRSVLGRDEEGGLSAGPAVVREESLCVGPRASVAPRLRAADRLCIQFILYWQKRDVEKL